MILAAGCRTGRVRTLKECVFHRRFKIVFSGTWSPALDPGREKEEMRRE